ncbi:hypothetical protein DDT52_11465 [Brenneria roseae subsp. roseae]|uniref:NirD/YgiW/YdeI family stress tolerance protein n=1 Tax=Brenneria roseae TaxID=1509241 RepID=UPI000D61E572|nr:NirD/YgiW/YdeI family stress tolerance protein [Brenneria roseae]PWC19963.1 hypothetical protein DDT52_11465 [Brenneria roseae subsp. roseae]
MKSRFIIGAFILAISSSAAWAQYIGPNGSPTSVKTLLEYGRDHDFVVLKGNIIRRAAYYDDLYEFSDGTGTILIKIDHKRWPINLRIDDKSTIEIAGKYDREFVRFNKIKVMNIRVAD